MKGVDIMIVTSMRCYLNIVTQFCDLQTLLNTNYYMGDTRTPDGSVHLSDCLKYNEEGQLVVDHSVDMMPSPSIGRYNIKYGSGELDPTPYITNVLVGIGESYADPHKRFIEHLNATDTMIATYDFLFSHELRGNKLQILIFRDDEIIKEFGDIICSYLAYNFGQDISFIDPMYRPDVKGRDRYVGDKNVGQKNINDLRDAKLLIDFNQAICQTGSDECFSNLTVYLNAFDPYQLMHLYNLLFPNDPLPPDMYTTDHIKRIIIGRVSEQMPKTSFDNIFFTDDYLKMLERYEQEEIDFSQDDEY